MEYLIQKRGYVGNSLLWWRKGNAGYTTNIDEAQTFTQDEAEKIEETSRDKIAHPKKIVFDAAEKHLNSESGAWRILNRPN